MDVDFLDPFAEGSGDGDKKPTTKRVEDQREFVRRSISVRAMAAIGREIHYGRTEDFSAGGACVRLDLMPPVGSVLPFRFLTPFIKEFPYIDVSAEVRYATMTSGEPPCRVGIKFVGLDAARRRMINDLLTR